MTSRRTKRERLFVVLALVFGLCAGLVLAEVLLVQFRKYIERSDQREPGMVLFDDRLGWRLAPEWRGRHTHYDFDVTYDTNSHGFRGAFLHQPGARRHVVLGDSFTFGTGVENDQTFVHLLHSTSGEQDVYWNLGVPGYSTDQQVLLLEQQADVLQPDIVVLVVYLGNDLVDNERGYPLQARHAKPFFSLGDDRELVLENVPVPHQSKMPVAQEQGLLRAVLGDAIASTMPATGWLGRSELFRRIGWSREEPDIPLAMLEQRFVDTMRLFVSLVARIQEICERSGAALRVVLLPGRSFVEQPDTLSARYQDYFRQRIVAELAQTIPDQVIDLASILRAAHGTKRRGWYYPHEGHLTPEGHRVVARLLSENLP